MSAPAKLWRYRCAVWSCAYEWMAGQPHPAGQVWQCHRQCPKCHNCANVIAGPEGLGL